MLQSLIRILHANLVQIDTEMAQKYANQQYAVSLCRFMGYWAWVHVAGARRHRDRSIR